MIHLMLLLNSHDWLVVIINPVFHTSYVVIKRENINNRNH